MRRRTEAEASQLRHENDNLRHELQSLRQANRELQEAVQSALVRIDTWEQLKPPPPPLVKPAVPSPAESAPQPRKKRDGIHNLSRHGAVPTQIVEHHLPHCPTCALRLGGDSLARRREGIDIPPHPVVPVTEQRLFKGGGAGCQKWHEAPVDLQGEVVGPGRIGVRLVSLLAYLRTMLRVPVRQICALLRTLPGVELSSGEIMEVLHRSNTSAHPHLPALLHEIGKSPAVQADETGWREEGKNGYIWRGSPPPCALMNTPTPAQGTS